jgi:8-oxo-dGTP pyrophosphatase MutT (NUDIX family)
MSPDPHIDRECVEGYLFAQPPLELLIFRRPPARGRIWVPVSGKVEPSDADYESAIRREISEETGLENPVRLFALDWHVVFPVDSGETWRLHAYGVEVARTFEPRLSDEHDLSEWMSAAEARRRFHYEDNRGAVDRLAAVLAGAPQNP